MKRFIAGFILGAALMACTAVFAAAPHIHLFVNGQEISFPEAPPQIVNDRVMVPARPLAEALGATVEWDEVAQSVIINQQPKGVVSPMSTQIVPVAEVDLTEWISLRRLSERGVFIDSGITLRNNGVEVKCSAQEVMKNGSATATVTLPGGIKTSIPIIQKNGQTWIKISDAKNIGLF